MSSLVRHTRRRSPNRASSRWPPSRRPLRSAARRGFAALELIVIVGVTLPISIGLFFTARWACGRLFRVIEMLVSWPAL